MFRTQMVRALKVAARRPSVDEQCSCDASDFRRHFARALLHAGLIVIVPNVDPAAQRRLFRAAVDALEGPDELIDRVLEGGIEGEDVTLDFYDLPAGQV